MKKIPTLVFAVIISLSTNAQSFEGIITFDQIEKENSILRSLIEMQNRPGPIGRYLEEHAQIIVAGDTLIFEVFDSTGVNINTLLQIKNNIYSSSIFSSGIFKNMTNYPPTIAKIKNWSAIDIDTIDTNHGALVYYIGSEERGSEQTIEIGVLEAHKWSAQQKIGGLFKSFFHNEGTIHYERTKFKDMLRVKKNFKYVEKEVSELCRKKISNYIIE